MWNKQLAWQPIPVHTMPVEEDSLLTNHAKCPRFEAMLEQLLESEEVRKINQDNAWLFEYLTEHSGMNITDMMKVNFLYDTLFIETVYNKTLPAWTDSVYPDKMSFLRGLAFTLTTWNHEMKRLRVGPLLKNLVEVRFAISFFSWSINYSVLLSPGVPPSRIRRNGPSRAPHDHVLWPRHHSLLPAERSRGVQQSDPSALRLTRRR